MKSIRILSVVILLPLALASCTTTPDGDAVESTQVELVDGSVCDHPALALGEISWLHDHCYAGTTLLEDRHPELFDVEQMPPAYQSRSQRCFDLKETKRICALRRGQASSCIYGLEIDCRRLSSPMGGGHPAIRSRCSDLTKNGIGYADTTPVPYRLDVCTTQSPPDPHVVSCTFLGQRVRVEQRFCDQLTTCVEPNLHTHYGGTTGDDTFPFPSGEYTIRAEASCSSGSAAWSNHHPDQDCRAIDFNVATNPGNLRRDTRAIPQADIPPELVAIMEGCGIVWGGRMHGAQGVWNGCDPMHFEYDPACLE